MLRLGKTVQHAAHGVTRRDLLHIGGLGLLGMSLADWWRASDAQASPPIKSKHRDPSCIVIFLSGGPSHHETFDPKPNAPVNIRGPYSTIRTNVNGIHIGELMPAMAQQMDKCAILRSMTSRDEHAGNTMMSGGSKFGASYGAVLAKLQGAGTSGMPPFAHVGASGYLPGAGTLGTGYNPIMVNDPTGKQVKLPQFGLTADVSPERFGSRRDLLGEIDKVRGQWHSNQSVEKMGSHYQRAIDLLTSEKVRTAFDLSRESEDLRTRYGGSTFGQSCILARRLVEAGTRFVQVNWYSEPAWHGWDVHGADLPGLARMESPLCPRLDQGLSTLLDDLSQRGLLSSTLVVVTGEFGRTPNVNKYGGRDHWPRCFSILFAGCGIPAGSIIGASDPQGGTPSDRPVTVPEFAATIYRLMGINTNVDPRIRPFIGDAAPVAELI